ncbi:Wadjet anti-phage system protein JetD domain-containing protein [Nitrosomonas communis]|uniref:Wadjet protein JetD C-terminal domain-containing protein n=1 Tax=Nitrosomonas communis TaxID=44574 RepID=A0A1H2T033_9PROT|nr:Wadjet anti-phage system protein JetD domain-containing protein [Nitrosomonas communis]SDW37201.1 hypothetical protein SAMN05421882_100927 [Nitrosomonas communis]
MNWTTPADLRAQLHKLWERGEILASLVTGDPLFPRRLSLKRPTSTEIAEYFSEVRVWIEALRKMPRCRLEMREFKHRLFGTNTLPHEVWIDTVGDALSLISKQREAAHFTDLVMMTRQQQPELLDWLAKKPQRALELVDEWQRLLAIVAWLKVHPRPSVYLRQVDIPGIHSKFIEHHRGVLSELLDLVLPAEAIDPIASGTNQFAQRYGFLDKPLCIRFRVLDRTHALLPEVGERDISLDADSFARLNPKLSRVFITENEINFLAFPNIEHSLIIFGAGYGFEMLRKTTWLENCRIYYWGDIDTHGFAMLDQLRSQFRHVASFLMDRATLLAFEAQWGIETKPTCRELSRLTPEEKALYDDLRDNRLRKNLRLEQERIGFGWVKAALAALR